MLTLPGKIPFDYAAGGTLRVSGTKLKNPLPLRVLAYGALDD
jgi:hypothetical protein